MGSGHHGGKGTDVRGNSFEQFSSKRVERNSCSGRQGKEKACLKWEIIYLYAGRTCPVKSKIDEVG